MLIDSLKLILKIANPRLELVALFLYPYRSRYVLVKEIYKVLSCGCFLWFFDDLFYFLVFFVFSVL